MASNLPGLQFNNQNSTMQTTNTLGGNNGLFPNMQSTQQFFMQPVGNAYGLTNSNEVSNMPIGNGVSVGLCLTEGVMYLKSMQPNGPALLGYKLSPLETMQNNTTIPNNTPKQNIQNSNDGLASKIEQMFNRFDNRLNQLQNEVNKLRPVDRTAANIDNSGERKWEI